MAPGFSLPAWLIGSSSQKIAKIRVSGKVVVVYADRQAFLLESSGDQQTYWVCLDPATRWPTGVDLDKLTTGQKLTVDGYQSGYWRLAALKIKAR